MTKEHEGPFWIIKAKPGETAPPVSDSAAERGYHIVHSDTEPEPAKDGQQ